MATEPKMISMKRTAADRAKETAERMSTSPMDAIEPDYPWGLCVHLEKDQLDKLGMSVLPKLGAEMVMTIKVKVTRVSQSASLDRQYADEQTSVDFQITEIGR